MIRIDRTSKILSRGSVTKFFLYLLISFSILFTSCDESSVVGLDVQPTNDIFNVSSQDTTTLITKTVREDSLRTDETTISGATSLIGKYIDPIFGESSASLYTQVALSTNIASSSFGTNPVCDSIVLSLVYDPSYYGEKPPKQQTIDVLELTAAIPAGTKYSNKTLTTTNTIMATSYNFVPKPTDSVTVYGVKLKPQLRVPLDVSFGQRLLNEGVSGTGLVNNAAFVNYLKGIYITTGNTSSLAIGEGNIMNFKMAESKITLYYKNDAVDSLKYDLGLGGVSRFSHFSHNYSGAHADLTAQLSATPSAQNDKVFLQAMAGVKVKIEMPTLMHWNDSGAVAINKADLVIKVDPSSTYQLDVFAAPGAFVLFGIDDTGSNFFLPDAFEGSNYFGGGYNSITKEYHFNISRYVQQVLEGKLKNNGLHLLVSGGGVSGSRVVVGGGGAGANQMKLNITYTKLH